MRFPLIAAALLLLVGQPVRAATYTAFEQHYDYINTEYYFWSHWYGGQITFTGADLVSVDLTLRSESRANGYGSDPRPTYPLEIGCSAAVGGACLSTPFFGVSGLAVLDAQTVGFSGGPKEEIYKNYRINNPTYPGIMLSQSFGEVSTILSFVFAPGPGPINYHLVYRGDSIPEPSAWALMILGFAGVGAGLRRTRRFA